MAKMYYDSEANLELLKGRRIAVIGYGSQGHAQAQNLNDSGLDVVVGLHSESKSWERAEADGLKVVTVEEAAKVSDVIQLLAPEEKHTSIFEEFIKPNLKDGDALVFSHGFNIHFNQVVPPKNIDVFMIAPKSPGHLLRRM